MTALSDLRFLVVEDDDFQRRWLVVMLANLGAKHIVEVPDGSSAMQVLLNPEQHIDISFIDLNMPGMDGMELIRHLAQYNHQSSIVLASAMDRSLLFTVETMAKAYGVDMLGVIEKPATPESLAAVLDTYRTPEQRHASRVAELRFTFAELQQGLKNQEFEPVFQPKVDLVNGQLKGVEAFARWPHAKYGVVPPSVFIPELEKNGEMDALAWMVIDKSMRAWKDWRELGHDVPMSINLSPLSLVRQGFADQLAARIQQHGIEPHYFTFEVTESAAMTDMPYFLENLARLRMRGFCLSVDDYGMGRASLQQLMRIPFTELKIDRSFVSGASTNNSLEAVLAASLGVCRQLNRHSVAVGVETQQDWEFLRQLGCEFAQGYYIARPMEAALLPAWIREWGQFF